jgi:hypothetical protein
MSPNATDMYCTDSWLSFESGFNSPATRVTELSLWPAVTFQHKFVSLPMSYIIYTSFLILRRSVKSNITNSDCGGCSISILPIRTNDTMQTIQKFTGW